MEGERERGREGGGGEVEGGKWLYSSISKLHATLAFHPFSNRCVLSKGGQIESQKIARLYLTALCLQVILCVCVCVCNVSL